MNFLKYCRKTIVWLVYIFKTYYPINFLYDIKYQLPFVHRKLCGVITFSTTHQGPWVVWTRGMDFNLYFYSGSSLTDLSSGDGELLLTQLAVAGLLVLQPHLPPLQQQHSQFLHNFALYMLQNGTQHTYIISALLLISYPTLCLSDVLFYFTWRTLLASLMSSIFNLDLMVKTIH